MVPFELVEGQSGAAALEAYQAAEGDAAYYAGGTELLLVLKQGFARFGRLIDVKAIPELTQLSEPQPGLLRIGAAVTHRRLETSPLVAGLVPLIPYVEHDVANIRVRNVGTIGGNLCFAEPHSDMGLLTLLVEAKLAVLGAAGVRTIDARDFFRGAYEKIGRAHV